MNIQELSPRIRSAVNSGHVGAMTFRIMFFNEYKIVPPETLTTKEEFEQWLADSSAAIQNPRAAASGSSADADPGTGAGSGAGAANTRVATHDARTGVTFISMTEEEYAAAISEGTILSRLDNSLFAEMYQRGHLVPLPDPGKFQVLNDQILRDLSDDTPVSVEVRRVTRVKARANVYADLVTTAQSYGFTAAMLMGLRDGVAPGGPRGRARITSSEAESEVRRLLIEAAQDGDSNELAGINYDVSDDFEDVIISDEPDISGVEVVDGNDDEQESMYISYPDEHDLRIAVARNGGRCDLTPLGTTRLNQQLYDGTISAALRIMRENAARNPMPTEQEAVVNIADFLGEEEEGDDDE